MDPDVHDVGHHPQLAAAPSAVEAVIEAAAAQAGDLKLSSAFVAGSGSADVRTLALPLGVTWRFHVLCFQPRRRGTKQVAAAPSSVALESSFTRQSSEANRMSLSQALQVPLCPLCWLLKLITTLLRPPLLLLLPPPPPLLLLLLLPPLLLLIAISTTTIITFV
jgi:hypothetical protein